VTTSPSTPIGTSTLTLTGSSGSLTHTTTIALVMSTDLLFTDDPLTSQVTVVKAVHVTDLRLAIDILRSRNGLARFAYSDSSLLVGTTVERALHLTDLREALNAVYDALRLARPLYTDPVIGAGQTMIKEAHIAELRSAVRAVW
jgi:hypothetical protein